VSGIAICSVWVLVFLFLWGFNRTKAYKSVFFCPVAFSVVVWGLGGCRMGYYFISFVKMKQSCF